MQEVIEPEQQQNLLQQRLFSCIYNSDHFGSIKAIDDGANPNLPREVNGPLPLEYAIVCDQFECFKSISAKGGNIKILIGRHKMTVLHFAVFHGRVNLTRYLLHNKFDQTIFDLRGFLPLHYAFGKSVELVQLFDFKNPHRFALTASGELPIHVAAFFGNTQMVEYCIDQGALASARDKYENTPMHKAAEEGHCETVRFLMTQRTSKNYWNKLGETPYHCAVKGGHIDVIELLIKPEKKYNIRALHEISSMHLAAKKNKTEVMLFLNGKDGLDFFVIDDFGRQPIHMCAMGNAIDAFNLIVSGFQEEVCLGAQPLSPEAYVAPQQSVEQQILALKDKKEKTVVDYAAKYCATDILVRLNQLGININVATDKGQTAMHFAARAENVKLMMLLKKMGLSYIQPDNTGARPVDDVLLKKKCGANIKDAEGKNQLHSACEEGDIATVDFLVALGFSLYETDNKGRNALHYAARSDQDEMIKHLRTEYNMDSKHRCTNGFPAIHHAVFKSATKAIRMLVEYGDSYEEPANHGMKPIYFACLPNKSDMFEFFADPEKGINIFATDDRLHNCVFYAAQLGNLQLLEIFANEYQIALATMRDAQNSTLLHIAISSRNLSVIKFLADKGVPIDVINDKQETAESIAKEKLDKAEDNGAEATVVALRDITKYLARLRGEPHQMFRGPGSLVEVKMIASAKKPLKREATKMPPSGRETKQYKP